MALYSVRLRRALPLCSSFLHHHFHSPKIVSPIYSIAPTLSATLNPQNPGTSQLCELQSFRLFRSSLVSFSSRRHRFDEEMDITENTILFEGCDYNHWLITVDFPKDATATAADKISTYENIAAQVFGSMEEAKKKIYACSTTVYDGFQVLCSEETSEKFKDVPGVVFVLPDSYIDPVNKQYGGDKYINGEIIHMPPPISYMKRDTRSRHQRNENRGPMPANENRGQMHGDTRNFGPPQNPPHQQNFGPPQNPPHQQNFGPPQNPPRQQNFGPPQNPPRQQNFGPPQSPPHQQNFGPPLQQNFGPPESLPHQQNFGPPRQQDYGHPHQQNFGPPHQQNFGPPPRRQNFGPPPQQQNFGPPQNPPRNPSFQQNFVPPQNHSFQQNFNPPQSAPQQNFSPTQNHSFQQNFNPPQSLSQQNFVPQRVPGSQPNYPLPQNAPPLENYAAQEKFSPQQNSSSPGIPSQQIYGPPGGIGPKDSTLASGVCDHHEAGRRDFQQEDQTVYTSAGEQINYDATGFDDLKYQGRH